MEDRENNSEFPVVVDVPSSMVDPRSSPLVVPVPIPIPRFPVTVRVATMGDLPFIDGLQKMHTHMVGWMPTKQLEGKIGLGHVLVAEQRVDSSEERGENSPSLLSTISSPLSPAQPVGYAIGNDQYFKRDDVGIIYQMNVVPGRRRALVGATLVKAMFERAAYGCRLFCCWCAQDIEANHFWESLGFVPLAFRAGSRGKQRVHIFWQRRIRAGDTTTPYWFPSQTTSGSIREDRLVLPIPPGTHWSDAKPIVLPALSGVEGAGEQVPVVSGQLPDKEKKRRTKISLATGNSKPVTPNGISSGGLRFVIGQELAPVSKKRATREREPRQKVKNDPKLVAAARELRDRWLEQVNAAALHSSGKYDVSRCRIATQQVEPAMKQIAA